MKLFKMEDRGPLFSYLGIDEIQEEDQICLNHMREMSFMILIRLIRGEFDLEMIQDSP